MVAWGLEEGGVPIAKRHKETFRSDGDVLYLDCGGGYTVFIVCKRYVYCI